MISAALHRQEYLVGDQTFNYLTEVRKAAKTLLLGDARTLEGAEKQFALDLLNFHPNKEKKLRSEIAEVKIRTAAVGTSLCFCLVYVDGREDDISLRALRADCYGKATDGRAEAQILRNSEKKTNAYRQAVDYQIRSFKSNPQIEGCECCGSKRDLEVDHVEPFSQIVKRFEESSGIEMPEVESADCHWGARFVEENDMDRAKVRKWRKFHVWNARLQMLCRTCNAAKSDQQTIIHSQLHTDVVQQQALFS